MLPQHKNEIPVHVRVALTTSELAFCKELEQDQQRQRQRQHNYTLMFPPFTVNQLSVKSLSLERELVGEYLLQFTVNGTHHVIMKADSREVRNTWLGVSVSAPSASTLKPTPLITTVKKRVSQLQKEIPQRTSNSRATGSTTYSTVSSIVTKDDDDAHNNVKSTDVYALYSTGTGDEKRSNVGNNDDDNESPHARRNAFRDTIMDFYDGRFTDSDDEDREEKPPLPPLPSSKDITSDHHMNNDNPTVTDSDGQDLANIQPRSIKILASLPDVACSKKAATTTVEEPEPHVPHIPPVPPMPESSSDIKKQKNLTMNNRNSNGNSKNNQMEVAPVKMTFIEPEKHQIALSTGITIEDDDNDEEDDIPLSQQLHSPTTKTSPGLLTEKVPQSPLLPRSSLQDTASARNSPSPSQSLNNSSPTRESPDGLQSVRAALAASVDSFAESTKSSPSNYSLTRGSSSTLATDRGSPNSIEQQVKPQGAEATATPSVTAPPPRKGSMPESSVRNEPNGSALNNQQQQPIASLPRTSSKRQVPPPPLRTTSIRQQQQQFGQLGMSNSSNAQYPYNRSTPTPGQSSSASTSQQSQQLPSRLDSHKMPSNSLEDLGSSPPESPGAYANATRQILYSHGECAVFHWKGETWFSAQETCAVHVRTTNANRSCLSIQLLQSRQLYLNAWIVPTTSIEQLGNSDVNISVFMGEKRENYLIHFDRRSDAVELTSVLQRVHFESQQIFGPSPTGNGGGPGPGGDLARGPSQRSMATSHTAAPSLHSSPSVLHSVSLFDAPMPTDARSYLEEVPQTLSPLMQCKIKLFSQQEHSNWNNMGSAVIRIAQQLPSKKTHVCIENGKHRLVSSIVISSNVRQTNPKRLTFLLNNENDKTSMVYMVQMKDEKTTAKLFEYLKTRNEKNGW
ncbi:hypothetical protein INT45_011617 [Circinella minor]|uniref:Uncharacterized protein n=1 Tax=Circinella minor TaxID=1195481 RepID=A0A8H7S6W0_9FUNG|nr:hypothetical protein INT45_011617 [Circinella minor]